MKDLLQLAATYDVWGLLSFWGVVLGAIYGYLKFFKPVKSIPNFTISFDYVRDPNNSFPLQLTMEFVNHTGQSALITSAWFRCKDLRPHPNARMDAGTRKMELKFPKSMTGISLLSEFECYLPTNSSGTTVCPLDPSHDDFAVKVALQRATVGYLECDITLISRGTKPIARRLRVKPARDYGYPIAGSLTLFLRSIIWSLRRHMKRR